MILFTPTLLLSLICKAQKTPRLFFLQKAMTRESTKGHLQFHQGLQFQPSLLAASDAKL